MKIIITSILCLFLAGCGNFRLIKKTDFSLPDSTMAECRDLPSAKDSTDIELLAHSKEMIKLYVECKSTNQEKKKILTQLQHELNK